MLLGLFLKDTNFIHEGVFSGPNRLPKARLPHTITLGISIKYISFEGTQTIARPPGKIQHPVVSTAEYSKTLCHIFVLPHPVSAGGDYVNQVEV